ncbi:DUF625-domain-containing protein [Sporormia fimetaria CBS 119925]|uniref:DUF625-domain-containing protein n=1 Tax=Sporormia fimetaria CBS 119925 TaxID=1340428 RepID=A0A6A6VNC8_9PLEO|nr:DUF625-domain-containing protein [Sporormia fimetaria CBS 119925]
MALSFQEPEGCAAIWDFVNAVQSQLQAMGHDDNLSDDLADSMGPIMLPSPDLGNLVEIENHMRTAIGTPGGREALAKFILNDKYILKLIPLVEMAEDLESLSDLHRLCSIMKMLVLLNDSAVMDYVVQDEVVLGVVGALEYDPDFPLHKANHRQYLSDQSKFKEVVRIEDQAIRKKIHHTYRLQYLKDVVLARILDDPTFGVLNSLIFFHQVEIVSHLQEDAQFMRSLFATFNPKEPSEQRKKDAVLMIQQCCTIAKNLQGASRAGLYQRFVGHGLMEVIQFALRNPDALVRVAGADILQALIDHDAMMVRGYIFKMIQDKVKPLTDTLIELLLVEADLGCKTLIGDIIKVLLDPNAIHQSLEALNRAPGDYLAKLRASFPPIHSDSFVQSYYEESVVKLFQPLRDLEGRESVDNLTIAEETLFSYLMEMLCFFLRSHYSRSKYVIMSNNLAVRVAQLLGSRKLIIKLGAVKFFRICLCLPDDFFLRQMISQRLFEPILQVVLDTMPRDNALNSACLEFFQSLTRDSLRDALKHVIFHYREKLEPITYVDTFQTLILKYDQYQEPVTTQELDHSFTSVDSGTPIRRGLVNGGKWGEGLREPDADEEAYFNTSDDEEEGLPNASIMNGVSPVRPLVNYPDDDGDDDMEDILATGTTVTPEPILRSQPEQAPTASSAEPVSPPERISEKRRREEEEDDELISIISSSGTKRKAAVQPSESSPNLQKLRRKNSMSHAKDSGAPRKISISIPLKSSGSEDDSNK